MIGVAGLNVHALGCGMSGEEAGQLGASSLAYRFILGANGGGASPDMTSVSARS